MILLSQNLIESGMHIKTHQNLLLGGRTIGVYVLPRGIYFLLKFDFFSPKKFFAEFSSPQQNISVCCRRNFFSTSFNLFFRFFPLFFPFFFLPFLPFFFPFFSSPPFLSLLFLISFEFSSLISDF